MEKWPESLGVMLQFNISNVGYSETTCNACNDIQPRPQSLLDSNSRI